MAGVRVTFTTAPITLTSATAKTLLQLIAAANQRAMLKEVEVSFNGVTPADPPIQVDLIVQTTAGTMTALTGVKVNSGDAETIQTTAAHTATAEPTNTSLRKSGYVHEQEGDRRVFRFDGAIPIGGGTRLGVFVTPGTLTGTVKAIAGAEIEE